MARLETRAPPAHSFEEHTSEVLVRLTAPDLDALFAEAGHALAALLSDEPPGVLQEVERISVQARDPAGLLVDWLNELIFLSETRKRVYGAFAIRTRTERELVADVRGWPATHLRTQVKAATFHKLSVQEGPQGAYAEVVLDV